MANENPTRKRVTEWADEELAASVAAYIQMMRDEKSGSSFSKADVYRQLSSRFGRTRKSIEYRMQNISAVLAERGRPWIKGLPPATNVGKRVKDRLLGFLEPEQLQPREPVALDDYRSKLLAMRDWLIGMACRRTSVTYGDVMNAFDLGHRNLRRAMSLLGQESQQRREPIITALIVSKTTGRCSIGIEKEFGVLDDAAERVRLYNFWHKVRTRLRQTPAKSPLEQRAAQFAQVELRPCQAAFRRALFLACHGQCVVSGCDIPFALDAAHRSGRDWRLGQNSSGDGYLLRKDLHALYDAGLLRITDDGVVLLDPTVAQHYGQFDGIKVVPT